MRRLISFLVFFLILASTLVAEARTVKGPKRSVGRGYAYAWVQYGRANKPIAVGVTLSKRALDGLPTRHSRQYILRMPHVPPYNHIGLNWNPMGHMPDRVYDVPHFDFHFYFISRGARRHITCRGSDLAKCETYPTGDLVPRDYVPTPGGEPYMGAHWIDPFADEFQGRPFTATLIHGTYDGRRTFIEPMVTREFMLATTDFMTMIKDAPEVDRSGYYPTHYRVKYDSTSQTYTVALVDLRYRAKR